MLSYCRAPASWTTYYGPSHAPGNANGPTVMAISRWWRRLWGRHPIPRTQQEEARRYLAHIRAQQEEVRRVSERLQENRDNFREALEDAFRAGGDAR